MFLLFSSCCNNVKQQEKESPRISMTIQQKDYPCVDDSISFNQLSVKEIQIVSLEEFKGTFLYDKHCKMCHGNEGKGNGVVARHNSELCPRDLTKIDKPNQCIYYVIVNGKNKMPGHDGEIEENDIWVLIVYINKEIKKGS
jgi:cytochrome c5